MNASPRNRWLQTARRHVGGAALVVAAVGLVASGCDSPENNQHTKAGVVAPTTAPGPTTPPTTAAAPTTTVADAVTVGSPIQAGADGLSRGASGPAVQQLRARLADLRFDVAPGNEFDTRTHWAVVAFQKQQGLPVNGKADAATLTKVAAAPLGPAMLNGEPTRVEIDLKRQMLQYWIDGRLTKVLTVSSGTGKRYCVPKSKGGGCARAVTPGGSFRAERKIKGLRVSRLGELYNPVYFNGGIALHGSPSVPHRPASHGCVRIPMVSSRWIHDNIAVGTPFYVLGGKKAPVPFNEQAPADPAPAAAAPSSAPAPTTLPTVAQASRPTARL